MRHIGNLLLAKNESTFILLIIETALRGSSWFEAFERWCPQNCWNKELIYFWLSQMRSEVQQECKACVVRWDSLLLPVHTHTQYLATIKTKRRLCGGVNTGNGHDQRIVIISCYLLSISSTINFIFSVGKSGWFVALIVSDSEQQLLVGCSLSRSDLYS